MTTNKKILTVTLNPAIDLACTVNGLTPGEVNRVSDFRNDAGGKGINIAGLLRKFDFPVTATGFLGSDNPELFEKFFESDGIEDLFVRVPGSTRTGIKILDSRSHTTTDLNLPGLIPSPEHKERLFTIIKEQLRETAVVVIAGSLPPGAACEIIGELVAIIRKNGVKVFVDTSGAALASAIDARPTFIKPNIDELSEYLGTRIEKEREILAEAEKFIDQGIETVVVSLGSRGAIFVEKEEAYFAHPPAINAVSTVGAGDAMVGCMVAGMMLNLPLRQRAKLATAVSANVVTQAGPRLATLENVRTLESQVKIRDLKNSGGTDE